jgi:peptidyl-prolyl cis-trans isomerase A (cyclophilin A)
MGCGAARDPDLELRALKARKKAETPAPVIEEVPPPPPAKSATTESPKAPERPLKRYGASEIATLMARVEGSGPTLTATFETAAGSFSCDLFERESPETVANFVGLVLGATPWSPKAGAPVRQAPFYDGTVFHRAIDQFVVQGGRPNGGTSPGWKIAREQVRNDVFAEAGALAMLDDGQDTHGSQFLVTLRPDRSMTEKYSAFGVCHDLDVVRAIAAGEKKPARPGESAATPVEPVVLQRIRLSRGGQP